jgi:hypothetical protein
MAVHGRFRQPCPHCQAGDRLLADRGPSRLLGSDGHRMVEKLDRPGQVHSPVD